MDLQQLLDCDADIIASQVAQILLLIISGSMGLVA